MNHANKFCFTFRYTDNEGFECVMPKIWLTYEERVEMMEDLEEEGCTNVRHDNMAGL